MSDEEARRRMMLGAFEEALESGPSSPSGFEIIHELDRGGMAAVYLARQLQPEREVALKVMLPRFAGEEETGARFQQEARAMAALDHPGVMPVYQVGEWDGMAFLVMKYLRGGSLQERLGEGLPEMKEAVDWMIQTGEAVHYAHQRGVLHRDLKPGNLLFDEDGGVYVGDFGVAKLEFAEDGGLTRAEAFIGTPNYLAPEVAAGESNAGSVAADLYGLGAVLYECLTGRRPHADSENLAAQLRSVVEDEVLPARKVRAEIPRDLEVICEKALAKNPEDRYGSVALFVDDLQRWREGRVILARPTSFLEKLWRWSKRHPFSAILSGLFLMTLISGSLLLWQNYQRRGELLQDSLIARAGGERLVGAAGFRERALGLLEEARALGSSQKIRDEATTVLTRWDVATGGGGDSAEEIEAMLSARTRVEEMKWLLEGGVLRCEPAWSPDERFLALVQGERMEVLIYEVSSKKLCSRITAKDWPENLSFDEEEILRVSFANGSALLANVRGRILLENFGKGSRLSEPIGFSMWQGQVLSQSEGNPYGGRLSRDEKLLATVSVSGVQIWDVEEGQSVEFYQTGNQRIDAPTDAWWVGPRELLLQIPGALEVLTLEPDGGLQTAKEIARVPGTKVLDVTVEGDWLVERRDEDGALSRELWPRGNSEEAQPSNLSAIELVGERKEGSSRRVDGLLLRLPRGETARQWFLLEDGKRVLVLSDSYALYEWRLPVLKSELEKLGF